MRDHGLFSLCPFQRQAFVGPKIKCPVATATGLFICSGGRIIHYAHDPQMGALTKKKPCPARRGTTVFFIFIPPLSKLASA